MRAMDDHALADSLLAFIAQKAPLPPPDDNVRARLVAAMPGLKERAKTLVELAAAAEFLLSDGPQPLDAQAEKILSSEARKNLREALPLLQRSEWNAAALESAVRGLAEQKGLKLGQLAQPLRAALTGKAASPPIFDMMAVLGRDETLTRISSFVA
jgi:glutamyl-tRNA synthetase